MKPTKSASGSPNGNPPGSPILSQRQWRKAGLGAIAACALLAWVGAKAHFFLDSPILCILYWGVFVVLMALTFFIVWLDIRYIRLQYALERRNVFRETLGDEEFRKALLKTQEKAPKQNDIH
ncbi:MAG TPA: hypothetical protein VMZ06_07305 [Candidatus Bathyarchaeia archaeon]|nr:hypothetical protein [Candidatus Bathyarchaeia archaeon]